MQEENHLHPAEDQQQTPGTENTPANENLNMQSDPVSGFFDSIGNAFILGMLMYFAQSC